MIGIKMLKSQQFALLLGHASDCCSFSWPQDWIKFALIIIAQKKKQNSTKMKQNILSIKFNWILLFDVYVL